MLSLGTVVRVHMGDREYRCPILGIYVLVDGKPVYGLVMDSSSSAPP